MKNIKVAFLGGFLLVSMVWFLADTLYPTPFSYFSFRTVFIQYSGVIGISMMSVALLLAVRPMWLERRLNGLDKMYRLHKWLGVGGLVFSVLHWWWGTGYQMDGRLGLVEPTGTSTGKSGEYLST
ncbi:ferric reductase-like transmembrane domain-containing protein [Thiomicrorhabdus heinhorstiae]|uniref:ferric reductase-like transmembrane domain-containing protein n=1 Tax=Thiomicrorhabdus heinhorstiae TaxID=2748010 RepID=UPI001E306DCB|nr:ferric reductase-like transmembrane domain-containing protein [Thiomicrorhabdus heinhorstiae]